MKNNLISQTLGLFWFVFIYALFRIAVAGPLSFQNSDMLAIVISMITLMWLILKIIQAEEKGLELSGSLLVASMVLLFYFRIYDITDIYVQSAAMAMLGINFLIFFILFFRLIRSKKESWKMWYFISVITRVLLTMAIIIAIEIYLVPIFQTP
ncbi:hypothetical protein JXE04_03530 [Patescibacteria group bacterium]|nr:hypothetical protein [Patescibacteria group bacterium]